MEGLNFLAVLGCRSEDIIKKVFEYHGPILGKSWKSLEIWKCCISNHGCGRNRRKMGSGVHGYYKGGQQWYGVRDGFCCVQSIAGRDQDNWQRMIVAGCDVNRLQRKIAVGSILPQGSLLAAIKEDDSERSLLIVLRSERCVLRLKG
ncbi:hypothetical protein B296_00025632 [Ensete ventricosum]|uniref:Uncharacterized protein n=1 Tax=Ensete ventricosum TaxID=4639 RepID=A0A426XVC1_ENSVE|nr:hypothetical protein B296_00025632 [Ensete ventricosum]